MSSEIKNSLALMLLLEKTSREPWIFRGETGERTNSSSERFFLRPKAGRLGKNLRKEYSVANEIYALNSFKKAARPYLLHEPKTDIEWLAIAQHHGMFTRLLDWSESLLVATWYAVQNAGASNTCGLLFGVKGLPAVSRVDQMKPFKAKKVALYRPPTITPRIPAQRSVFTLHPVPTDDFHGIDKIKVHEWRFSPELCGHLKHLLNVCAINESILVPDLDGLSRHIGWLYKWGKFPPKTLRDQFIN